MINRLAVTILLASSLTAAAQFTRPTVEVGAGLALRHTEGFYIPRFSVAGHKIFKGIGLYATYEQRNNANFTDDFNGDGDYQRYLVGPTFYLNPFVYAYGGISPFGPYGLGGEGGFGKVRKEIGLAYVFAPFTLHAGYSNWVGATTGVGYQFGVPARNTVPFQSKSRPKKSSGSELAKKPTAQRVDTIVVTKEVVREVVKEVPVQVVKEEVKKSTEELAVTLYFNLNSTTYTSSTAVKVESLIAELRAKYPNAELLVVGNTDESGSNIYNYNLGLARAQKVANYLMAKTGMPESKIVVRSDGKVRPQSDKKEDNRRVDVYVILDK